VAIDSSPLGYTIPDVPLEWISIQIKLNSRVGLLSTAITKDLYDIAVVKGNDQAYPQYLKYSGGVMAIDFVLALGTYWNEVAGLSENLQFSFTAQLAGIGCLNYQNIPTPATYAYEMHVIPIYEGTIAFRENWSQITSGILTPSDLESAIQTPHGTFNEIYNAHGGSVKGFFQAIWRGIKKALPIIAKVAKGVTSVVSNVAPFFPGPGTAIGTVAGVLNRGLTALGAGEDDGMEMGEGGRRRRGRPRRRGGMIMSTDNLAKRL
jgi:hypothetical protein